jgi:hypothetical protein
MPTGVGSMGVTFFSTLTEPTSYMVKIKKIKSWKHSNAVDIVFIYNKLLRS